MGQKVRDPLNDCFFLQYYTNTRDNAAASECKPRLLTPFSCPKVSQREKVRVADYQLGFLSLGLSVSRARNFKAIDSLELQDNSQANASKLTETYDTLLFIEGLSHVTETCLNFFFMSHQRSHCFSKHVGLLYVAKSARDLDRISYQHHSVPVRMSYFK